MPRALVIGAGIGGLAAAARLTRAGYEVTVLEKQSGPGGRCSRIAAGEYIFDTGATLYLMPPVFAELFDALGTCVTDHLDLIRVDPAYRIHFQDGSRLDLTSDLPALKEQLEAIEPGAFNAALRFLARGGEYYRISLERFVGRNFFSLTDYFSPANLPLLLRAGVLRSHHGLVSSHFRDPRLQAAFSFQNMYLGLSPFEAMATYALLQYTEIAEGIHFPRGGMFAVVEALCKVGQGLGVEIEYNCPVTAITTENGRATGCTLADGRQLKADIIVANADLPYVYTNLLPEDGAARRLSNKRYTSSALIFCWGLRGCPGPELLHHNVFVADREYRRSFERIFRAHTLPERPSFYVCAPSRSDPGMAPAEGDCLMVLVPVGHLSDNGKKQDWEALHRRGREAVVAGLAAIGITVDERLEFEQVWGPPQYRQELNLLRGSAFGLSHNFTQVGYLRPHNRHRRYKNLYFVGAGTHPGTGVPLVLLSARLVTERIVAEQPL